MQGRPLPELNVRVLPCQVDPGPDDENVKIRYNILRSY